MSAKNVNLLNVTIVAPEEFDFTGAIGGHPSEEDVDEYFIRLKGFIDTMRGLDRVVLIHYEETEDKFYLSSLPETI